MPIGFIKSKKAYTLVEILIATFLFLIIGSIITWLLIKGLKVVGQVGGETTSSIRTSINLDVLHFDIIHAGYGISNNEKIVLSYCNGTLLSDNPACSVATELHAADNKLLLLRETSNVFDLYSPSDPEDSVGFAVWNGTGIIYADFPDVGSWDNPSVRTTLQTILDNTECVWEDPNRDYITTAKCNGEDLSIDQFLTGFPLDNETACKDVDNPWCCTNQECTSIAWYLYTPSTLPKQCVEGTKVLYRTLRYTSGYKSYTPVLNCVADWDIWFGLDTDGDGKVDTYINEIPDDNLVNNNFDLHNELKLMKIYLLVQGSYSADPKYDYDKDRPDELTNSTTLIVDTLKDADGEEHQVVLKLPPNYHHYRWIIYRMTINEFPNIPTQ